MSALDILGPHRVVPVVVLDDAGRAADLGDALRIGGLPVAEVTFRSPGAVGVLGALAARGDLLVGAGTVLTTEQVDRAHDAGAGLLAALGASANVPLDAGVAGLQGVSRVDLKAVGHLLTGRRLTLVVPPGQLGLPLLGLRGITSRFGRDQGWHPELLLATDASLQAFTAAAAPGARRRTLTAATTRRC